MTDIEEPITTIVSTKGAGCLAQDGSPAEKLAARNRLIVEETPDGVLLKAAPIFPPTQPEQVFASLAYAGPRKTVEEMPVRAL